MMGIKQYLVGYIIGTWLLFFSESLIRVQKYNFFVLFVSTLIEKKII